MKKLLMTAVAIFGLTAATMAQNVPSYVPTNGLVGWWPFDGNANDESGNGYNGVVNGATLTSDRFGNIGKAYYFNNDPNKYISTDYFGIGGTGSRTISFWIKTNSNNVMHPVNYGGYQTATSSNAGSFFQCTFNYGGIGVNANTGYSAITYQCPVLVNNDQWANYVWVFDSVLNASTQNIQIYQNGILLTNVVFNYNETASMFTNIGVNPLVFGKDYGSFHPFFGSLDDIGIWNRALNQQEITDLYNGCQLTIITQPTNQNININNNTQFVTGSSDLAATFQWQTDLGVGYQNLNSVGQYSGATNSTLTISNVTMSNNNQPFRCIVSSGTCTDTSNVAVLTVNNNLSIDETTQENNIAIFPSPANDIINVKVDPKLIGENYSICDNTGKVVMSGELNAENTTIEFCNLSSGIYLFTMGDNFKRSIKIIKY